MASVSGATSSLGNTSLRGYGGFGSGIDRDSIIEQMTAGTQSKITNQKNKMTSLGWKQEAFQAVSDKMLALQDNYFSFASGTNLKYPSMFAKNQITAMGDSDVTKFVSATGASDMLEYLSILGVKQLATSSSLVSDKRGTSSIKTNITEDNLKNATVRTSLLEGRQLRFGSYNGDQYQSAGIFTFPSSYTIEKDGKKTTVDIDYTVDPNELKNAVAPDKLKELGDGAQGKVATNGDMLAYQLNEALKQSGIQYSGKSISDILKFEYNKDNNSINIISESGTEDTGLIINTSSSALSALGYNPKKTDGTDKDTSKGIKLSDFNDNQKNYSEPDVYVAERTMKDYLVGKKLTITLGGQTKQVELIKSGDSFASLEKLRDTVQERLDMAFGKDNIKVSIHDEGGSKSLQFDTPEPSSSDPGSTKQSLTITSDSAEVRKTLGIKDGGNNKLNLNGSIESNIDKLIPDDKNTIVDGKSARETFLEQLESGGLVINNVKIDVTKDTSLKDMIDKINANKDVGVKASYLSSTNQFVLVSNETGKGRVIDTKDAAATIFGSDGAGGTYTSGENAQVLVSYGNGINTMIESSSNTFDLEGLRVTVSQEFGNVTQDTSGVWNSDRSKSVTFSAKADVDGVTEAVKKFVEEYNEMIKEINTQVTTRPDKAYGPLTEEQQDEMSEKSIENWEKKAKQGLLYNDATMRALSLDMQGVLTNLMANGANYKDLEEMGITISDDYLDGGTITFDEAKFKAAMTSDPEKVSDVFTGGGDIKKGLASIIEDTLTPYATKYANRNGNSYGRLIEEAGSEKIPLSIMNNQIYKDLKEMQSVLDTLNARLASEQDRYISQFTTMETLINQMNSQASYLAQFQA